jgi:cytochrome P450
MTAPAVADITFDPLSPEFLDDPYPIYAELRAAGQVLRSGPAQWIFARYEQVSQLLRDPGLSGQWPESFQQMRIGDGSGRDFLLRVLLHREGADHDDMRRVLHECLRLTPMPELRATVERLVDVGIDELAGRGSGDIMSSLALPVPAGVACEMLGIPAADRPMVQERGLQIIKAFNVLTPAADRIMVDAAVEHLREYLAALLDEPTGKIAAVAAILERGTTNGSFSREELVDNLIFLLVSGFTTTVHMIANVCATMLAHPAAAAAVREDQSLLHGAVDEFLRYDSPIQHISRFAAARLEVNGQVIRPGRVVHLLLGSANRDELVFAEPDKVDIRRDPNPHLGFGAGVHACLGAGIGRMEATILLSRILRRCGAFEPDGEPVRRPLQVFRSYERIPVRIALA